MGDDAWIWRVSSSVRKFNYLGDAHIVSGVVQDVDADNATVTITAQGQNQRGEVTCDWTSRWCSRLPVADRL